MQRARHELEQASIEIVGEQGATAPGWIHFRAPDGNPHELASRRSE